MKNSLKPAVKVTDALVRVLAEQPVQQVRALGGDALKIEAGNFETFEAPDHLTEIVQIGLGQVTEVGLAAEEHDMEHHSDRPQVALRVVLFFLVENI